MCFVCFVGTSLQLERLRPHGTCPCKNGVSLPRRLPVGDEVTRLMRDPSPQPAPPPGPNPALWVVAGVLAFTVVASFLLLYVALQGREPELPAHYRWEGPGLDADLERADAARRASLL